MFVFANPTEEKGEQKRLASPCLGQESSGDSTPIMCHKRNGELTKRNIALIIQQRILSLSFFLDIRAP